MITDSDRDPDRLELMVELIDAIERRTSKLEREQFLADKDESDLTAFRLGHIGENAFKLSDALKQRHPDIPWSRMRGLRNIVSHHYGVIDPALVWKTATEDLETLRAACAAELARLPE